MACAHALGFSITLKCAASGIKQNLLNVAPSFNWISLYKPKSERYSFLRGTDDWSSADG